MIVCNAGLNCSPCASDCKNRIEVKPTKYGHLIETIQNGKMKRVTSCCNSDLTQLTGSYMPKFCPNCGAELKEMEKRWKKLI